MAAFTYRLQTLLDQKEELKKQAERELVGLEAELKKQTERMQTLQDTVQALTEKHRQMRRDLFSKPDPSGALNAHKVQERMEYAEGCCLSGGRCTSRRDHAARRDRAM